MYSSDMKIKHPRTVKDFKGKVALEELRRAHWIIVILALALAFLIMVTIMQPLEFDIFLGSVAAGLLLLVAAVSAAIALRITVK